NMTPSIKYRVKPMLLSASSRRSDARSRTSASLRERFACWVKAPAASGTNQIRNAAMKTEAATRLVAINGSNEFLRASATAQAERRAGRGWIGKACQDQAAA